MGVKHGPPYIVSAVLVNSILGDDAIPRAGLVSCSSGDVHSNWPSLANHRRGERGVNFNQLVKNIFSASPRQFIGNLGTYSDVTNDSFIRIEEFQTSCKKR
jgi:hypothetical protein